MKKWLYCALLIGALRSKEINATPYAGSIAGAGQSQKAFVTGYHYIKDNTGPTRVYRLSANRRFFAGRVPGKIGPSGKIYYSRWRNTEADQNSSSVHSRR